MDVLRKILYFTFGKISNGILLIVVGFVMTMFGIAYRSWTCVIIGSVFVALGVVLSFIREAQYTEAVNHVSKLRANHRGLKLSINEIKGQVELLRGDLDEANAKINSLSSIKVVDLADGRKSFRGKKGPAFSRKEDSNVI